MLVTKRENRIEQVNSECSGRDNPEVLSGMASESFGGFLFLTTIPFGAGERSGRSERDGV
jgi:hypothetical protein